MACWLETLLRAALPVRGEGPATVPFPARSPNSRRPFRPQSRQPTANVPSRCDPDRQFHRIRGVAQEIQRGSQRREIQGTVTDSATHRPVFGAAVSITETQAGVFTDSAGALPHRRLHSFAGDDRILADRLCDGDPENRFHAADAEPRRRTCDAGGSARGPVRHGRPRGGEVPWRAADVVDADASKSMDPSQFVRLSRGALANIDMVQRVSPMPGGTYVVTLTNQQLNVSRLRGGIVRDLLLRI